MTMSPNLSIKCSPEMMKKIEDHCFSETQIEVGGYLVGNLNGDVATVTNVFAAQHTVGASTQLTFTHESWNAIYEQLKNEPEASSLIGWFHSHPNFGVFLSEHDKFIQQNFFKQDGQITIVVDPIRGRRGWFYSKNGKIETYKNELATDRKRLGVSDSNADENIEAMLGGGKGRGVSLAMVIAISMTMSLLSFVAGWTLTTSANTGSASQATVTQLQNELDLVKLVLIKNGIGVPQVPTKQTLAPTKTSTPAPAKPAVSGTPKVSTPKITSTAKASTAPIKAVKGQPCVKAAIDPKGKLTCQPVNNKFIWSTPLSSSPKESPATTDSSTAVGK
jgi:proteasome lid subunit RPN8/RPN11